MNQANFLFGYDHDYCLGYNQGKMIVYQQNWMLVFRLECIQVAKQISIEMAKKSHLQRDIFWRFEVRHNSRNSLSLSFPKIVYIIELVMFTY